MGNFSEPVKQLRERNQMIKLKHIILTTMIAACLLTTFPGFPALLSAAEKTKDIPPEKVHITSDEMMYDEPNSLVEFTGNVVATRLDATIYADRIKVVLFSNAEKEEQAANDTTTPASNNVKELIASGNVKVIRNDGTATADRAVYSTLKGTIVLTGKSPTVVSGNSRITGKKITLFQDNRRVVVESEGARRVEAFFDSRDTGSTENGQAKN